MTDALSDPGIHRLDVALPSSPTAEKMLTQTRSVQGSAVSHSPSRQLEEVMVLLSLFRERAVGNSIQETRALLNTLLPLRKFSLSVTKGEALNRRDALTLVPSYHVHEYLIPKMKS